MNDWKAIVLSAITNSENCILHETLNIEYWKWVLNPSMNIDFPSQFELKKKKN